MAIDWGNVGQSTLGGATTGGGIGLMGGPVGGAIGAGAGGLLGLLAGLIPSMFGGNSNPNSQQLSEGLNKISTMSPEQQQALLELLSQGQNTLQNPYAGFEGIENQARSNFQQQAMPGLAERFAAMGNNAPSSPSYQAEKMNAMSGLEGNLAALRSQYGMQNKQNALGQLSLGLTPTFQTAYKAHEPGFGENMLSGAFQNIGNMAQGYQLRNALQDLMKTQGSKTNNFWQDFNSIRGTGLAQPQQLRIG